MCVLWVSSDVLMCTASIWHMCTMSMDRYFTLKYPMRYGRNKTRTMVVAKIFFVWIVSVAISSPICIHGFVDPSIVFTAGSCVPVLKDFVIYGSVFAFYIPLLIMIVTYVLTINILWRNQELMTRIGQSELRPKLAQLTAQCTGVALPHIPRFIKPVDDQPTTDSGDLFDGVPATRTVVSSNGGSGQPILMTTTAMPTFFPSRSCPPQASPLAGQAVNNRKSPLAAQKESFNISPRYVRSASPRHLPTDSDSEDEEADLPSTHLLQYKSMSYRSLSRKASNDDFFLNIRSTNNSRPDSLAADKSGSFRQRGERRKKSTHLDVPSQVFYRRGRVGGQTLYNAKSDTQLPSLSWGSSTEAGPFSLHLSFNGLSMDYKSMEWDRRFFQIQQEMDACLLDNEGGDSDLNAKSKKCRNTPTSLPVTKPPRSWVHTVPLPPVTSTIAKDESESDNDADTSASSNSDMITIRLHPPASPSTRSAPQSGSGAQSDTSVIPSVVVSSEADNTQEDSDVLNTNDESPATDAGVHPSHGAAGGGNRSKHKRLLKARFRNTIRASARPMFKHLISKKTACNERKASKVLGIIFIVFVTLWTPFFIVNILSVTCSSCMEGVTGQMMSLFTWMGYVASLANPIIYTMFNTSFRRTFIKILTCKMQQVPRRTMFSDNHPMSNTTVMPSDRRNTMTVLLDSKS